MGMEDNSVDCEKAYLVFFFFFFFFFEDKIELLIKRNPIRA